MPRITAHVRQYPPHRYIGAELAVHELLKYLADRGWDVTARVTEGFEMNRNEGGPHLPYGFDGIMVTDAPVTSLPAPDVVLHSTMGFDYARAQADMHKALRVMWLHGGWASWQVQQIKAAMPGLDLVAYNSESMRRGIEHIVSGEMGIPATVLHPPVWPLGAIEQKHPDRCVTLVNTTEGKGARIFYDLAEHMPLTSFLAVRGGHGLQIEPPELHNLTVMPHGSYMPDIWDLTSVLLMPSSTESWGMVAVEAMHRGIPVIGMDVPGLAECLGWGPDGQMSEAAMPLVQPQDCVHGIEGWAAVLKNVLAGWDHWSVSALARSDQLDPAPELEQFEATLLEHLRTRKGSLV